MNGPKTPRDKMLLGSDAAEQQKKASAKRARVLLSESESAASVLCFVLEPHVLHLVGLKTRNQTRPHAQTIPTRRNKTTPAQPASPGMWSCPGLKAKAQLVFSAPLAQA